MPALTTDDGVAISYATQGDGPPHVLFMHGWAGSGRYFDATLEHLDLTRLGAVTYDLRGHRESGPSTDGYTLERIAADALAVADAAGLGEFVVLGFSMSAKFCQYLSVAGAGPRRRADPGRRLSSRRDPAAARDDRRLAEPGGRPGALGASGRAVHDAAGRAGADGAVRP